MQSANKVTFYLPRNMNKVSLNCVCSHANKKICILLFALGWTYLLHRERTQQSDVDVSTFTNCGGLCRLV
jgi:hypothetical protein